MTSLCSTRSGGLLCCQGERKEPLVDISDLYSAMLRRDFIVDNYFVTTFVHRTVIENQLIVYAQLASDDSFWPYLATRRRKPTLPLHLKIEEFVKHGIPPHLRSRMWLAMSGVQPNPQFTAYLKQKQDDTYASQIKLDVPRSYPALQDPSYIEKLTKILTAYSCRNPKLGYCQSMNMLGGTLLIFMEEENAFWMLVHLIEELLPNYHSLTMSGFLADAQLFEWLVGNDLPELHKHFRRVQVDLVALTAPWFLCLFIHELPTETAFVVWDYIMLEGISVVFEVGLAILRMFQDELLQIDCEGELMVHIRKRTQELYNPEKLHAHLHKLDKNQIKSVKRNIRLRAEEEESRVAIITTQLSEIAPHTHCIFLTPSFSCILIRLSIYDEKELSNLWRQHTVIFPFLCYSTASDLTRSAGVEYQSGVNFRQFSQFVGGTFSEWWVDSDVVEHLFKLTDANKDGVVEFTELVSLLSVMCRGNFSEIVEFNFQLFDVKSKGNIDKFDLARMLQSVYGVFRNDSHFDKLLRNFVNDIFDFPGIKESDTIPFEHFDNIVLVQPQILDRFMARNPNTKFNPKNTFFYWMFATERPCRDMEIIHFALDRQAPYKQPQVPKPSLFHNSSIHFAVY